MEHCVAREVREEVGLEIGNIRYLGSQSWPFPHSLMLGFHAEYVSGEIVMQPDEIEDARWFAIDELPHLPAGRSIARYLIDVFLARRAGRPDPVLPGGGLLTAAALAAAASQTALKPVLPGQARVSVPAPPG